MSQRRYRHEEGRLLIEGLRLVGDAWRSHVHPLQLDVIERYIDLRTSPGERVLTPFMGVGSEVYVAVQMGRFGIGAELKPSYYVQATRNLSAAATEATPEASLFDDPEES